MKTLFLMVVSILLFSCSTTEHVTVDYTDYYQQYFEIGLVADAYIACDECNAEQLDKYRIQLILRINEYNRSTGAIPYSAWNSSILPYQIDITHFQRRMHYAFLIN